jgi:hypothetical protein
MDEIYTFTAPVFVKMLEGLKQVLTKAEVHYKEKGLDESQLINDRLAPDMFPFVKQVQVACDNAKGAMGRLSGGEVPKMEDTETTIQQLIERIDKTLAYINTVPKENFTDSATRTITLPYWGAKFMTGLDYAREYAIPNFFFHVAMAYALVRKNGVAIGKADYIINPPLQDA